MADSHDKEIYKRPYNRPNEHWVCGRSAEGRPCPHGPSRRGRCEARSECVPAKIGDRWVCTRPEQYGGACDSPALEDPAFGPMERDGVGVCCKQVHCTPQRSLRALRGRVSVVFCLVIVGILLTVFGSSWRNDFLSPGPLTLNHQGASMASVEKMEHGKLGDEGSSEESCQICHANFEGGLEGLVLSAISKRETETQSAQCLNCHQEDVGADALFAHALSPESLAQHTAEAKQEPFDASKPLSLSLASFSPGVKLGESGELACAACHREHNGTFFDLRRIGNQKCQSCHTKQFKSIGDGHPDFSTLASAAGYDYPYRRRTRLIYDHERHETNYFQKEENLNHAPADCTSCHEIDGDAFTTRLKPFEEMCAACHTSSIVSSRDEWIHVYGFPSLESDVYEILEDELELPPVPRTAAKSMSPFMMLLLAGFNAQDGESAETFAEDLAMVLEFEGDLSGIAYDEDPEIVGRLFKGMEYIKGAASNEEQGGLRRVVEEQLERLTGEPVDPRVLDAMFGFPKAGSTVDKVIEDVSRKDIIEMSGWHVEESGFRLDPASWKATLGSVESYVALAAAIADGDAGSYATIFDFFSDFNAFQEWFTTHFSIDGDDWVLLETGKKAKNKEWKALIETMVDGGGAAEDGAESEEEGGDEAVEEDEGDAEEADESEAAETPAAPSDALSEAGDAFVAWLGSQSKVKKWLEDNADISGERWTLRAPRSLYYRPIQHADPFTTAWLDFTATLYAKNPAAALVFDELSGRATGSAIGSCMKCHSIDAEKQGSGDVQVKVNWKSGAPERGFTKFKHTPHLKLMNCAECHRADWVPAVRDRMNLAKAASAEEEATVDEAPEAEAEVAEVAPEDEADSAEAEPAMTYLDSFKANDSGLELGVNFSNAQGSNAFVSSFRPISKDDCARCHEQGKAGDSCLICHNYHIQERGRSMGVQSLRDLITMKTDAAAPSETP